jgi:drug/metabolite transporter (DMT)-like permease
VALTAGILVPVLITFVYYFAVGAGPEYIRAAFMQNFGYLSSWSTGSHSGSTTQSGLMQRGMALMGLLVGFLLFFWKGRTEYKLVWIWLGFSLFGALLSERPYPHYLIQVLASFSLLIQMNKKGRKENVVLVYKKEHQ